MTPLKRLVAVSILVVSASSVAFGGDTQGPPLASPLPPTECVSEGVGTAAFPAAQPADGLSFDIVTEATIVASWLAISIL